MNGFCKFDLYAQRVPISIDKILLCFLILKDNFYLKVGNLWEVDIYLENMPEIEDLRGVVPLN